MIAKTISSSNMTYIGQEESGVISFKGIPYAKPPVGKRRWKAPEDLDPEPKRIEAFSYGSPCIQPVDENEPSSFGNQSEDCLTLNIWTRELEDAKKPVMVFIHGGGFIGGGSNDPLYDGKSFVKRNDIVLVSINYRVNIFGFLDLEELGGKAYADSKNLGILDQIKALEWINAHIHLFGGDLGNITIFGESCGGASVSLLMTIPKAKGLFHRVIAQSGTVNLVKNEETAKQIGRDFVKLTGARSVEDLLALDADQLRAYSGRLMDLYQYKSEIMFAPTADGKLIPLNPYQEIENGCAAGIDCMIGTTKDEMAYWRLYYPDLDDILEDYLNQQLSIIKKMSGIDAAAAQHRIQAGSAGPYQLANDILFHIPAIKFAKAQSRFANTWMYFFTWSSRIEGLGACHAIDLPFVFHNLKSGEWLTGKEPPVTLADRMQDAWVSFARNGNPAHHAIPAWPAYDPDKRSVMQIDENWRCTRGHVPEILRTKKSTQKVE